MMRLGPGFHLGLPLKRTLKLDSTLPLGKTEKSVMNLNTLNTQTPRDREAIQLWLQQQPPNQRRDRRLWVREFLAFVQKPLSVVTLIDVQAFAQTLAARGVPPAQAQARLSAIRSLFAYWYRLGLFPINIPLHQWPKIRIKGRVFSRSRTFKGLLSTWGVVCSQRFPQRLGKYSPHRIRVWVLCGLCLAGVGLALPSHLKVQPETSETATHPRPLPPVQTQNVAALKAAHVNAFLDTIAWAEGTAGPHAYRMQFTGTRFSSFQDHPREIKCGWSYGSRLCSDAAGKYQFLSTTWDRMAKKIGAEDFSPANQDRAAIALLDEYGVLEDIEAGSFAYSAIQVIPVWPSFQDVGHGDRSRAIAKLNQVYQQKLKKYSVQETAAQN
jgi:muramidase (phage lysozyme)